MVRNAVFVFSQTQPRRRLPDLRQFEIVRIRIGESTFERLELIEGVHCLEAIAGIEQFRRVILFQFKELDRILLRRQ